MDNKFDFNQLMNMAKLFSSFSNNNESKKNNNLNSQQDNIYQPTIKYFDDYINNQEMKIIKSALPFIEYNTQKKVGVIIKVLELKKTIDYFQSNENMTRNEENIDDETRKRDMLYSIKNVCKKENKCMVDFAINTLNMRKIFDEYQGYKKQNSNLSNENNTTNNNQDNLPKNENIKEPTSNNEDLTNKLKSMLTDDQQKMFDTFSNIMKNKNSNIND